MRIRWAPRSLLTIALAAIVVLVTAIGWLGWLLIDQDRALERQRLTERLDSAADLTVAELSRQLKITSDLIASIAQAADPLKASAASPSLQGDDVAVLVMDANGVRSSRALPFYPDQADPIDSNGGRYGDAEALELAGRDLPGAFSAYERLTASPDPSTRAGGLVRLARLARRLDRPDAALAAYGELAKLGTIPAAGRPADLVATVERCNLLMERSRSDELGVAAADFERALRSGRWRLSRGEYYAYLDRIRSWSRPDQAATPAVSPMEVLAEGAAVAWRDNQGGQPIDWPNGNWRVVPAGASSVLISRQDNVAIVVTPSFAERTWLQDATRSIARQRARITLTTDAGQAWFGDGTRSAGSVQRSTADTGLPFALTVTSNDPTGDSTTLARRRWLWAGMFGTIGLLLLAGGYIVARGISKELEVARLQSDFVAAVSHEFRTPVAAVRQLSEILDEGRVPDEARRSRYYGLLRRESERLQRLVEGLLDFRRMEANAAEYRFEVLDPGLVVTEIAEEFINGAGPAAGRLATNVEPALPSVRMDREAITRALWNLLDNAAKYSAQDAPISLEASADDGRVVIRVRDQGPGIPAAEQRQIFNKFVRGESARASGAKGTGLGLAMVAHIVRAHHGDVRLESRPGAGSTFSIVLPAEGRA